MKCGGLGPGDRVACVLVAILTLAPHRVLGQTKSAPRADPEKQAAGRLYDEAVSLFDAAKYAEAARAFLRADELSPSAEALESAIASARRAHDHLLVVAAAKRAIERESRSPTLATGARVALTEAETHLARVNLDCTPEPCALSIDGKSAAAGEHHLLPGTHTLSASGDSGASVEERRYLAAGSTHRLELTLLPSSNPSITKATGPSAGRPSAPAGRARDLPPHKPLPPSAFYAGAGVTAALILATTWSGLDALAAAEDYRQSKARTTAERNSVDQSVRRTDILLLGVIVAAGLTTYAAVSLVDWNGGKVSLQASPGTAGVVISGAVQ